MSNGYRLKEELFAKQVFWNGLLPLIVVASLKSLGTGSVSCTRLF